MNLDVWAWHVIDSRRDRVPDDRLHALLAELESMVPERRIGPDHVGLAVPLRLKFEAGELRLLTTLAHFGTGIDVAQHELHLEAFLPADDAQPPYSPCRTQLRAAAGTSPRGRARGGLQQPRRTHRSDRWRNDRGRRSRTSNLPALGATPGLAPSLAADANHRRAASAMSVVR